MREDHAGVDAAAGADAVASREHADGVVHGGKDGGGAEDADRPPVSEGGSGERSSSRRFADGFDARWLLVALILVVVFRYAWVCDDAFITFRTIDNFLHGFGLRWNVAERVQTYTHPLWMMVMTLGAAVTGEYYWTSIFISTCLTGVTLYLLGIRLAATEASGALALLGCALSSTFVIFSTSGLENALSFLLIVFAIDDLTKGIGGDFRASLWGWLFVGLALANRMDLGVLVAPLLAVDGLLLWKRRGFRALLRASIGLTPFVAWEIFSLVYYGFPFPNTAYAKLNTGIPAAEMAMQGVLYLLDALQFDPVLPALIAAAIVVGMRRGMAPRALLVGILLQVLYIIRVGGDFMSGRFLSPAFVAALVLVAQTPLKGNTPAWLTMAALMAMLGLGAPRSPVFGEPGPPEGIDLQQESLQTLIRSSGIADERGFYYGRAAVLSTERTLPMPKSVRSPTRRAKNLRHREVREIPIIGAMGFTFGPDIHVLDPMALSDPLLARLPAFYDPKWRVGHYMRTIPIGYEESLRNGDNRLSRSELRVYYDHLRSVTRDPLFSGTRWKHIWKFNTGQYDDLIKGDVYAWFRQPSKHLEALQNGEVAVAPVYGLRINMGEGIRADTIRVQVQEDDQYRFVLFVGETKVLDETPTGRRVSAGWKDVELSVAAARGRQGRVWLYVYAGQGDGRYRIARLGWR